MLKKLPILRVRRTGQNNTHADLRVRRDRVLCALQWLQQNNPFYTNITIDLTAIQRLPDDGIPPQLMAVDDEDTQHEHSSDEDNIDSLHEDTSSSHSFLPLPKRSATEEDAIRAAVNGEDVVDWQTIGEQPLNKFNTPGLASLAFPTLLPYGTGDPTYPGRQRKVTLADSFKHLTRYANKVDGTIHWQFASHPRFPYWALNMKPRHQLISQSSIYLHQHPTDAHITIEQLRDMVGHLSGQRLMQ